MTSLPVPASGVTPEAQGPRTPEDLAAAFLLGYTGRTREAYTDDLRDWGRFLDRLGLGPFEATRAHVEAYARELDEVLGRSQATIGRRLSTLAGFYDYALDEGLVQRSPVARVRRPRVGQDSQRLGLDRAEVIRFLDAAGESDAPHGRDAALAYLLALNGLRVAEICRADVTDLATERGHRVLTITRKGGARVLVPLAPPTIAAVERHVDARIEGPLIRSNKGQRLDRFQVRMIVRRLARAAGIEKNISPHSLRHTFVTAAFDAGVPDRDIQDAAGHADPRTTRRYDRGRHSLDRHATYAVAAFVARDDG